MATAESTIRVSRNVICEDCCDNIALFSGTNKLAAKEARELGWKFLAKGPHGAGWYCPDCQNNSKDHIK